MSNEELHYKIDCALAEIEGKYKNCESFEKQTPCVDKASPPLELKTIPPEELQVKRNPAYTYIIP